MEKPVAQAGLTDRKLTAPALLPAIALVLSAGCASGETGDRVGGPLPPRNILLVVVDTLRADHLGCYGFPQATTPNLDDLAGRGVRFTRYTTVVPTTLASFTSMLTGRYPNRHGVYRNGVRWPEGLEGVQGVFRAAGYETAGFVASYCLSSDFGIARGFDYFGERLTIEMPNLPQNKLIRRGAEVTREVIAWLDSREAGSPPFFAMVHYFDPHWPYQPPPSYAEWFDPGYAGPVTGAMPDFREVRLRVARNGGRSDADSRHLHSLHLGEIRYADEQIGALLEGLSRRGLDQRTLVVVTADHGETFHEHWDLFNHGLSVYDTNIRIPLIVSGPGVTGQGRAVALPFANIDLAPTLLDYAGLEIPADYEGASFHSWLTGLTGADGAARRLFSEATKPHHAETNQRWPNRLKARCVLGGRWKLIHTPWRENLWELYDLADDPQEQRNLWTGQGSPDPGPGGLAEELAAWSERSPDRIEPAPETREELRERLRALGYVE